MSTSLVNMSFGNLDLIEVVQIMVWLVLWALTLNVKMLYDNIQMLYNNIQIYKTMTILRRKFWVLWQPCACDLYRSTLVC